MSCGKASNPEPHFHWNIKFILGRNHSRATNVRKPTNRAQLLFDIKETMWAECLMDSKYLKKKNFIQEFRLINWASENAKLCVQIAEELQGVVSPTEYQRNDQRERPYVHTDCGKALF